MIRTLTAAVLAIGLGFGASAAEPEDTLMIQVEGQANGVIEIELLPELAPAHVERIKILARDGVYNDVVFHRVIKGFMAQTGDVKFGKREGFKQRYAGQGGSNYPDLPAEFSTEPFVKGVVGMARSQNPNSANSQFFIMFAPSPNLNGQYTVFGRVIEGQDIVDSIKLGARAANGAVSDPDVMKRVWIKADG
jgi:cyclophilin family peptidyl-prolyl cis-trans isomerase